MTIRNFDVKKTVMCQTTPDMRTYTRVQCAVCLICTVLCHFNTIYISFVIVPWQVFHHYCNNSQFKVNIYCMCYMGYVFNISILFHSRMKDIELFGQVYNHPSYTSNPRGTIHEHLQNKLKQENDMDL